MSQASYQAAPPRYVSQKSEGLKVYKVALGLYRLDGLSIER